MNVTVIGAGLAGAEAAWQRAQRGIDVTLREMKPEKKTPAHETEYFAELCCSNSLRSDQLENAVGLLKEELRRLGLRVPGDASVMGYDDLPLAAGCEPPLTTFRQDRLALGKCAFSLLDSLMNGVAVSKVLLRPQLIVRESTGHAPVRK